MFICAYNVKTASIYLYLFLIAKLNLYFTFPNLHHQNIGLSSTCNGLSQTNTKRQDFERF